MRPLGFNINTASNNPGAPNGVATLDGTGKLTTSQIPSSIVGAVVYQGVWNASTNTPTLTSGVGTKGFYYIVSVSGTTSIDGNAVWNVNDWIIYNGTTWNKIDGTDTDINTLTQLIDGTAAAPALRFANDSGMGVYRNTAGTLGLSALGLDVLRLTSIASAVNYAEINNSITANAVTIKASGTDTNIDLNLRAKGTGNINFQNSSGNAGLILSNPASSVNYIAISGSVTGVATSIGTNGSDTNIDLYVNAKGTGSVYIRNNNLTALRINAPASTVNNLVISGSATGVPLQITASGSDTNIGLVLSPKGNGYISAQLPDNGITGGNARGQFAIDLQMTRTNAAQVASGYCSLIFGGRSNAATGGDSAIIGSFNTSSTSGIAIGYYNSVSVGYASIAIGNANILSGNNCIGMGDRAADRGQNGLLIYSCGRFANDGDAQAVIRVLRGQSTDATPKRITGDNLTAGTANTVNLPNNSTYLARYKVTARQIAGSAGTVGDSAGWYVDLLIKRGANAAATSIVGTPVITRIAADTGATAWTVSATADTTNGGVAFTVTAEANKTVQSVSSVDTTENVG